MRIGRNGGRRRKRREEAEEPSSIWASGRPICRAPAKVDSLSHRRQCWLLLLLHLPLLLFLLPRKHTQSACGMWYVCGHTDCVRVASPLLSLPSPPPLLPPPPPQFYGFVIRTAYRWDGGKEIGEGKDKMPTPPPLPFSFSPPAEEWHTYAQD